MKSTSEKGHAKNLSQANLLITLITNLGTRFNPSNPALSIAHLQAIFTNAFAKQALVNSLIAPYAYAVDVREILFAPLSKKITKLFRVFKSSQNVSKAQMEDFMTIARKIKGDRKTAVASPVVNPSDTMVAKTHHSVSQLSYDQRINNFDILIGFLNNTPGYDPNEAEYQITNLQTQKAEMLNATHQVGATFIPLNNARSERNDIMYLDEDNLVDTFNKAKDYLFTIFDKDSMEYKEVARIKFSRILP